MNKTAKVVLIVAAAILLIIAIIILVRPTTKPTFSFPETVQVYNYTKHQDMDTLSKLILYNALGIDTINLYIYYTPIDFSTGEIAIQGYILKNHFQEHTYNIFVKRKLDVSSLDFLSHELIHLQQMENDDLIQFLGDYEFTIYRGDTVSLLNVPYLLRPYEIDAVGRSPEIRKLVRKLQRNG